MEHHKSEFRVENRNFTRFHTVYMGVPKEITTWAIWTSFLIFSVKNRIYALNILESCKGSPKVSADIFWDIGDHVEPQKSDFSPKIVQKLVNPSRPPPCLVPCVIYKL